MKWNDENIKQLISLVEKGYRPNDIAEIMGTTYKSINCKMGRLNLKVIYKENQVCKNCKKEFEKYFSNPKTFCSSSCAVQYNNRNRKLTEETKKKISDTLKNKPKICTINEVTEKLKIICNDCKLTYYEYYRPSCFFKFDVKDFIQEFDLSLVEQYGWYSPTNKRNNLKGVSKDHMYSVMDGFRNKINPNIISHPANCKLLLFSDNSIKKDNSSITIEELLNKIKDWDEKYKNF
jgi:transposase